MILLKEFDECKAKVELELSANLDLLNWKI